MAFGSVSERRFRTDVCCKVFHLDIFGRKQQLNRLRTRKVSVNSVLLLSLFSFKHLAHIAFVCIFFHEPCEWVAVRPVENQQRFSHLVWRGPLHLDLIVFFNRTSQTFSTFMLHILERTIFFSCTPQFCRILKLVNLMLFPASPSDFRSINMKAFHVAHNYARYIQTHFEVQVTLFLFSLLLLSWLEGK